MKPIDVKKKLSAAVDGVASNSYDYCVNGRLLALSACSNAFDRSTIHCTCSLPK